MWESIQNGKRVNKIFESKDGNYISNFTVQGNVEKIEKELVFIRGFLKKKKITNQKFQYYLDTLVDLKYILVNS